VSLKKGHYPNLTCGTPVTPHPNGAGESMYGTKIYDAIADHYGW